jgi:hypothetical protein
LPGLQASARQMITRAWRRVGIASVFNEVIVGREEVSVAGSSSSDSDTDSSSDSSESVHRVDPEAVAPAVEPEQPEAAAAAAAAAPGRKRRRLFYFIYLKTNLSESGKETEGKKILDWIYFQNCHVLKLFRPEIIPS